MTAPLPRVLTIHTPDLVDLIQDPHAQGPVLVHMNAISGYRGQEAGVDHQFIHYLQHKNCKKTTHSIPAQEVPL